MNHMWRKWLSALVACCLLTTGLLGAVAEDAAIFAAESEAVALSEEAPATLAAEDEAVALPDGISAEEDDIVEAGEVEAPVAETAFAFDEGDVDDAPEAVEPDDEGIDEPAADDGEPTDGDELPLLEPGEDGDCGHPDMVECSGSRPWAGYTYEVVSTDEGGHTVTGEYFTWKWCPDCGQEFDMTGLGVRTFSEGHRGFEEDDSKCRICDAAEGACTHGDWFECRGSRDYEFEYTIESKNEREHTVTGVHFTWKHCNLCGEDFDVVRDGEMTWTEDHDYDEDDVCRWCRHKLACEHEHHDECYGSRPWERDDYTFESINEREHQVTGVYYTWKHCNDCDRDYDIKAHDEPATWTEGHHYDENDQCRDCDHTLGCEHPNMEHNEGFRPWDDRYTCTVLDTGDDRTHAISGQWCRWDYCPDCDREFDVTVIEERDPEAEGHDYDEDGVCRWCGHVNSCEHPNMEHNEGFRPWDDRYTCTVLDTGDDRTHAISGQWCRWDYCPDCDREFDVTVIEERGPEAEGHDYDEDGVCRWCGHVNSCQHGEDFDECWGSRPWECEGYVFESVNDREHRATGVYFTWKHCNVCDRDYDIEAHDEPTTWTEGHDYDENGYCWRCKHTNDCQHPNADHNFGFRPWDDRYPCTIRDTGDNRVHEGFGQWCEWYYCPDCDREYGITVIDVIDESNPVTESHEYDENGCCWRCGHTNDCQHGVHYDECWGSRPWDRDGYEFEAISDREHRVTGIYCTWKHCQDCDRDYDIQWEDEPRTWTEGHDYDENGYCWRCDHTNACEHPNMEHNEDFRPWEEGYEFSITEIPGDHRCHKVEGMRFSWDYCPDCDREYNVTPIGVGEGEWEHEYNEADECEACGHLNRCLHEHYEEFSGVYEGVATAPYTFVSLNDREHEVTGDFVTWSHCYDCDSDFDIFNEGMQTWIEGHWYDEDGVCQAEGCDHTNTCEHPNRQHNEGARPWEEGYEYTFTSLDDREHEVTGMYFTWFYCPDCDRDYDVCPVEERTWPEHHWYDENGVCQAEGCDHSNGCEHPNVQYGEGARPWEEDYEYTFTSLNDREHEVTGMYFTWIYCPDCDRDIEIWPEGDRTWTEGHWYDENGVCEACDHENGCQHERMEHGEGSRHWEEENEYTFTSIDDREHMVTGEFYTWDYCPDCDREFNIEGHGVQTWTEHHWYDEDGVYCEACDHDNTCQHPNMSHEEGVYYHWEEGWSERNTVEALNTAEHQITGEFYTWDYCPDCDQNFNVTRVERHRTWTEGHWYNEVGICELCGADRNECLHEHTEAYSGMYDPRNPDFGTYEFESVGPMMHRITGNYYTWKWCEDCRTDIEIDCEGERTWLDWHWMEDGACALCGQAEGGCAHERTFQESYVDGDPVPVDADVHANTGAYHEVIVCANCNQILSDVVLNRHATANEGHVYRNGDPVCLVCGYETECAHAHTEQKTFLTAASAVESLGANGHRVTGVVRSAEVCSDCGVWLGEAAFEEVTDFVVPHEFMNGECLWCNEPGGDVLALNIKAVTLGVGETFPLKSSVAGTTYATTASKKKLTVDANGVVKAVAVGSYTVTASAPGNEDVTVAVKVVKKATSVKLSKTKATLGVGQTLQLKATLKPAGCLPDVTWTSSNPAVATVDDSGLVELVGVGKATITAKAYGGKKATCKLTVKAAPESVKLNREYANMNLKGTLTLSAALSPKGAMAVNTFSSSDESVATVSSKGKVTAKGIGTAIIKVKTYNGKVSECVVTVWQKPTGVTLNMKSLTLTAGMQYQLEAYNASDEMNPDLSWSGGNKYVKVDNGLLTAVKAGSAKIKVKNAAGKTATCKVTVKAAPKTIVVSAPKQTIGVGDTMKLTATLTKKTWSPIQWSVDGDAVTVDEAGNITAEHRGRAMVTATAFGGASLGLISNSIEIEVKSKPGSVSFEVPEVALKKGKSTVLVATLPWNTESTLTFSSDKKKVATVDSRTGKVTGKGKGTATITVTTHNGKTATCLVTVK